MKKHDGNEIRGIFHGFLNDPLINENWNTKWIGKLDQAEKQVLEMIKRERVKFIKDLETLAMMMKNRVNASSDFLCVAALKLLINNRKKDING